jgi:MFS transporter, ACS family, tartrate transporter
LCHHAAFLPVFWCLPTRFLRGTAAAGGIALLNAVGSVGGLIGPNVLGLVMDATGSFSGGLAAVSALTLGGDVAMWMLRRVAVDTRRPGTG